MFVTKKKWAKISDRLWNNAMMQPNSVITWPYPGNKIFYTVQDLDTTNFPNGFIRAMKIKVYQRPVPPKVLRLHKLHHQRPIYYVPIWVWLALELVLDQDNVSAEDEWELFTMLMDQRKKRVSWPAIIGFLELQKDR